MSNPFPSSDRHNDLGAEIPAAAGIAVLLVGAALGAVAALMLAPKAGRDLRADFMNRAGNWKNTAAESITQGRDKLIDAVEAARKNNS